MSAPQITTETLIASIDRVIDNTRDEMRDLAETANTRPLTEDEIERWHDLIRFINRQVLQRDKLLAP